MLVEYQRRIAELSRKIADVTDEIAIKVRTLREFNATLEEVHRLHEFYKDQMVERGRILPESNNKEAI